MGAKQLCLILALICFAAAALLPAVRPEPLRFDLLAAGLALLTLSMLIA